MKEKQTKTISAMDHIGYALYAFGGLGIEILLMMLEANFYGRGSELWSAAEHIIHWLITCLVWGGFGLLLLKRLPSEYKPDIPRSNLLAALLMMAISIAYTSLMWNGFKPAIEFSTLGSLKFLIQYLYYAFESLLILLILAHGQNAFEAWFRNIRFIPFGGILLAATWGLIHIFTQGFAAGIYAVAQSLLYGSIYLLLNKNYKISYVAIALLFMI